MATPDLPSFIFGLVFATSGYFWRTFGYFLGQVWLLLATLAYSCRPTFGYFQPAPVIWGGFLAALLPARKHGVHYIKVPTHLKPRFEMGSCSV